MPAGLNDNYTGSSGEHRTVGGMNYHPRNGNVSDQPTSAEEFFNAFSALPEEVQLQIFQTPASHYRVELGGEAEAEDQSSPMQFSNGSGTAPHELLESQTGEGTFSERDTLTSPRAIADQRPRHMRQRRQAHDRRLGQDIDQGYRNQQSFEQRWGALTRHVDVWGGR